MSILLAWNIWRCFTCQSSFMSCVGLWKVSPAQQLYDVHMIQLIVSYVYLIHCLGTVWHSTKLQRQAVWWGFVIPAKIRWRLFPTSSNVLSSENASSWCHVYHVLRWHVNVMSTSSDTHACRSLDDLGTQTIVVIVCELSFSWASEQLQTAMIAEIVSLWLWILSLVICLADQLIYSRLETSHGDAATATFQSQQAWLWVYEKDLKMKNKVYKSDLIWPNQQHEHVYICIGVESDDTRCVAQNMTAVLTDPKIIVPLTWGP